MSTCLCFASFVLFWREFISSSWSEMIFIEKLGVCGSQSLDYSRGIGKNEILIMNELIKLIHYL